MCSGKGGCGRSSIARALLVSAAQHGLSAIGIDFDPQATLFKWYQKREYTRKSLPAFVATDVRIARLQDWRGGLVLTRSFAFAVMDLPPTIEEHMPAVLSLCEAATLILVPTSSTPEDLDSVLPWLRTLGERRFNAVAVLNRVNRQTRLFQIARSKLLKAGPLAPIEIPAYEDIPSHAQHGLTVLDIEKAKGADAYVSLWDFVRREITV